MAARKIKSKPIRVGVVGLWRGLGFAQGAQYCGMELVALCDTWEVKLREAQQRHPEVAVYTDYDKFLEHDMDAVVLANYFHQHAPFAIRALNAGMHVMSETMACKTLGEGVALARAVEKSKKIYHFAENYCFMAAVQEMRRLYHNDEIGAAQFADCSYNHPCDSKTMSLLAPGLNHWRNWIPSTYYPTHALGPIMYITDARPVSVNAHSIARPEQDLEQAHVRRNDPGSTILCRMDNGAMTHVFGLMLRGHDTWYRLHGTRGVMETMRGAPSELRVWREPWDLREGEVSNKIYTPNFPVHHELAQQAGHGGGDFFTNYFFAEAIRSGEQPYLNVYRGLDMSIVGIQAWKSCLDEGRPYEIPDFRSEAVRVKYENENWSPFAEDRGPGQPPPSIRGNIEPTSKQKAAARKVWKEMGYEGE